MTATIRVLDLLILTKARGRHDRGFRDRRDAGQAGAIRALEADIAEILAAEDVELLAEAMQPGSVGRRPRLGELWAAPFASATRRAGGQLIATGRIPIQAIAASIEADSAASQEGN